MFGKTSQGWPRALCQQNINKNLKELKISWEEVDERTNVCGFGEIISWVYESQRPKPDRNKNRAGRVMACWVWEWTTNLFFIYSIADSLHIWIKKKGVLHPEKWVRLVSLIHTTCITASVNLVAISFSVHGNLGLVSCFHFIYLLHLLWDTGSGDEHFKTKLFLLDPTASSSSYFPFPWSHWLLHAELIVPEQ